MAAPKKKGTKKKKKADYAVAEAASQTGVIPTMKKKQRKKAGKADHTVHTVVPQKKGMGLALKFTLFVGVIVGLILVITIKVNYDRVMDKAIDGINRRGGYLCKAFMNLDRQFLEVDAIGIKILNKNLEWLQTVGGLATLTHEQYDELRAVMLKRRPDTITAGAQMERFQSDEVLQIFYYQRRGTEFETLFGAKPFDITVTKIEDAEFDRDVKIIHGSLLRNNVRVDIRAYKIENPDGYGVQVVMRNDNILQLQSDLKMTSILIALISLMSAVMGVAVLSSKITKPIGILAEDMLIVARGKLGHLSDVSTGDEVGVLAKTFNLMSQDLEISHEAELQKFEQDKDLELARDVQISLVPTDVPQNPKFSVAPFYRSAKEVGGDYYDVVEMDADHTAYFVADVSGKGVQGAMIMAMTRGIAHSETRSNTDFSPSTILSRVNETLARDLRPGSFVTAMCLIVNHNTGKGRLASAGHNPLVLVRHKAKDWELFNPTGIALGFDKGPLFNRTIKDMEIQIKLGDRVVIYTDGVVEAMSPDREEYGMPRFRSFCVKYAALKSAVFIKGLVADLDKHKATAPQHDDITIISLRKLK